MNLFAPEAENDPALFFEYAIYFLITFYVSFYLGNPELSVGLNVVFAVLPIVSVPKFAITEYSDLLANESNVGFTRNILDILAVTKAPGPEFFSEIHFNFRILGTDTGHIIVNLFWSFRHNRAIMC